MVSAENKPTLMTALQSTLKFRIVFYSFFVAFLTGNSQITWGYEKKESITIAAVDTKNILGNLSGEAKDNATKEINQIISEIANKNNIDLVLFTAAFIDHQIALTDKVRDVWKGKTGDLLVNLPNTATNPKVNALNGQRIFDTTTDSASKKELISKVNFYMIELVRKHKIVAILQEAAYVSPSTDITDNILERLNSSESKPYINSPTNIAVIDGKRIFSEFPNLRREDVAKQANDSLSRWATKNNIGLILQDVSYSSETLDCTNEILQEMKKQQKNKK